MLHATTCIWDFKKLVLQKRRVEWWLPGTGGGGAGTRNGEMLAQGYKLTARK